MLYDILSSIGIDQQILQYLSCNCTRAILALFTSLICGFISVPYVINIQLKNNFFQPIRTEGPQTHLQKPKTPTMGGIAIIFSIFISTILWADYTNHYVWAMSIITLSYGILGFIDDLLKVKYKNSKGISARMKLSVQFIIAIFTCAIIYYSNNAEIRSIITIPIWKNFIINLGIFYLLFGCFVLVGTSNAVNLTDGLDGLLSLPMIIVSTSFAIIAYKVSNFEIASNMNIFYIAGSEEVIIFCMATIGACLAFLWYNAHPAQIFMGDTGSLALGGLIGSISLITKQEILLIIIGGLFVVEAISVIIQIYYFKMTNGKRFFKMAPIHHHFEKCGWSETKVVVRMWIFSLLLSLISLIIFNIK